MNGEYEAHETARQLDDVAHGIVWFCPHCGAETKSVDEPEGCPECGESMENLTMIDYLGGSWYNDEITVCMDDPSIVKDGSVMIAYGGPNIWVDTRSKSVKVYWGFSFYESPIETATADEVREVLQDIWTNNV